MRIRRQHADSIVSMKESDEINIDYNGYLAATIVSICLGSAILKIPKTGIGTLFPHAYLVS